MENIWQRLAPIEDDMELVSPNIYNYALQSIDKLHKQENKDLNFDEEAILSEIVQSLINAVNLMVTTLEE